MSEASPSDTEHSGSFSPGDRSLVLILLGVIALAALIYLLQVFATILQQLLTAGLIGYMLVPIHRWFRDRNVPFYLTVGILLITSVATAVALAIIIRFSLEDLALKIPEYNRNVGRMIERTADFLPDTEARWLRENARPGVFGLQSNVEQLNEILGTIFGFVTQIFVVLIYLLFILAEAARLPARIDRAFRPDSSRNIRASLDRVNYAIGQYIVVKTFVSALTGFLTAVALYLYGVEYPILWGVVTFVLNYIPYVGALVAMFFPVMLSVVQFGDLGYTFLILLTLTAIQNVIGWGIEPYMTGARVNLSPFVVIASLAFWAALWGGIGMILAIPLMVVTKTFLENFPATRPIAVMLSNDRFKQSFHEE